MLSQHHYGCWVNRLSVGGGACQRQGQETTELAIVGTEETTDVLAPAWQQWEE